MFGLSGATTLGGSFEAKGALIAGQGSVLHVGSACSFLSSGGFDMEGDQITFETNDAIFDGDFASSGNVVVRGEVRFHASVLVVGPLEVSPKGAILKIDGSGAVLSGGIVNNGALDIASTAEVLIAGLYTGTGAVKNRGTCSSVI